MCRCKLSCAIGRVWETRGYRRGNRDDYTLAEGEKARNKLERYTLTGGGWWEYGKSVEEHKNNGKCCFEGVPSKRLFGEMW
ncbi:MAG: hypothetical protein MR998_11360 [Lachnospiraceae bacterium]|nr:hypothetical protein [Lachnospiraceae bacterium]